MPDYKQTYQQPSPAQAGQITADRQTRTKYESGLNDLEVIFLIIFLLVASALAGWVATSLVVPLFGWGDIWRAIRVGVGVASIPLYAIFFGGLSLAAIYAILWVRQKAERPEQAGPPIEVVEREKIRMIAVKGGAVAADERGNIFAADLAFFVRGIAARGAGQKVWRNVPLPSGSKMTDGLHEMFTDELARLGYWQPANAHQPGKLLAPPGDIIDALQLEDVPRRAAPATVPRSAGRGRDQ